MFCPVCQGLAQRTKTVLRGPGNSIIYRITRCPACDLHFDLRASVVNPIADLIAQARVSATYFKPMFDESKFYVELETNQVMVQHMLAMCQSREVFVEIGVGLGLLTRAVAPSFERAYGLDLEIESALSLGRIPDNLRFLEHEAFFTEIQAPICALCAWHVLEHLPRPHAVLGPLFDRMNAGAVFFGQVPLYSEAYVMDSHFVFYTEQALMRLCGAQGFSPIYFERDEVNDFLSFAFRRS